MLKVRSGLVQVEFEDLVDARRCVQAKNHKIQKWPLCATFSNLQQLKGAHVKRYQLPPKELPQDRRERGSKFSNALGPGKDSLRLERDKPNQDFSLRRARKESSDRERNDEGRERAYRADTGPTRFPSQQMDREERIQSPSYLASSGWSSSSSSSSTSSSYSSSSGSKRKRVNWRRERAKIILNDPDFPAEDFPGDETDIISNSEEENYG
eukprot:gb/GEZN01014385.1/.p1 GENE.gb/GEZN01014385.1/~~gb/GEZN01014385.1/.p1  ORF type:complete len:225 (-),score=33.24 gb/GEZN01014385.1/:282-911(-)